MSCGGEVDRRHEYASARFSCCSVMSVMTYYRNRKLNPPATKHIRKIVTQRTDIDGSVFQTQDP